MKTILYNSATNKVISQIFDNGYLVDGKPQEVLPPIYELEYIPTTRPVYDPILQVGSAVWIPDTILKTYTQVWTVRTFEPSELPTLEEAKAIKLKEIKEAVKELHQIVQWYIEMQRVEGSAIPAAVLTKIKAIKTKYDAAKAIINGYTTVADVLHWQVPQDQIDTVKESLEAIT